MLVESCSVVWERALEIFWQKCARDYAEREDARQGIVVTESEAQTAAHGKKFQHADKLHCKIDLSEQLDSCVRVQQ